MFKYLKVTSYVCGKFASAPTTILNNLLKSKLHSVNSDYKNISSIKDRDSINGDWNRIGNDMWRSIMKYDETITKEKEQ